ncbi:EamA family transporter RarD [Shimia abyssi]|uniref:Chloramphenicol-sensitive protein RarD n=1 Tax=Shimia abyssi TaxID=1662395 RepID=A0A2P8FIZ4_9RHOB|nr:EamA family transporter RarD [Shimia abyssi]PSL21690.1 chloramphenicol-sensitive protein RarD [Shimia abyssi]
MGETQRAILAILGACVIWGLSPLFYRLLAHIPPIEVLAHRTLWSAVLFTLLIAIQSRLSELTGVLRPQRQALRVLLAALLVSFNWFVFIWSIGQERAIDASMGYFLFPLATVLLGRMVLGERQSPAQWFSVVLAAIAVLTLFVGLGVPPWIAVSLAGTFSAYGLIKKTLPLGPVISVTAEVLMLSPVALIVLWQIHGSGQGYFATNLQDSLLLICSGLLTATPLILFSRATRHLPLSTVGLLQYTNPSLQFLCAVLILSEPLLPVHMVAFPLIWIALAVYSIALWRQEKAASSTASAPGKSSTT